MGWINDYNRSREGEVDRAFVYAALGLLGIVMGSIALEQSCSKNNENLLEKSIVQDTISYQKNNLLDIYELKEKVKIKK